MKTEAEPTRAVLVMRRLRADILSGSVAPGARLSMSDLTARYDVGMSPVREALSRLVGEGLVVTIGQRGFRVADVSQEDFADILMLRQMVEETGIRRAIAQGGDVWEAELVAAFHLLEKNALALGTRPNAQKLDAYEAAHRDFHVKLIAGAGSARLSQMQGRLYDEARRYRALFYRKQADNISSDGAAIVAPHREILNAVLARNATQAAKLIRSHVALIEDFDLDG